jgi:hypothetical protein
VGALFITSTAPPCTHLLRAPNCMYQARHVWLDCGTMYEGASCSEGGAVREQRARLLEPGWAPAVRGVCALARVSDGAVASRATFQRNVVLLAGLMLGSLGHGPGKPFGPYCLCRHVWIG